MPPFDAAAELARNLAEEQTTRGGYKFAYKFITDFDRDNSGAAFRLADGTLVWRLRIRSAGALSVNVLFTEFELPQGARLFLYNPAQTQILGAFDHLNNSETGILPVAPVWGDEIIVEYQEPPLAPFAGRLRLGEVNHAYRNLSSYEPGGDSKDHWCMPGANCLDIGGKGDSLARSAVLITIDGTRACTAAMVNNAAADGRPLMLTASHCLNNNFKITNPDYAAIAGRIITFFNYNSPTCDTVIRGAEEMSVASARLCAVNERTDMALVELLETPPSCYRPLYAGWTLNATGGPAPYYAVHHPQAGPKRINMVEEAIALESFQVMNFLPDAHWRVDRYALGCTDVGSSGAPLFNDSCRLVGLLSGGSSTCDYPRNDFYYSIAKSWEPSANAGEQLRAWLDSANVSLGDVGPLDPHESNPSYRLSNILEARLGDSIEVAQHPQGGNLFGINSTGATEYAEEYHALGAAYLEGIYIVTPSITDDRSKMNVELVVYSGIDGNSAVELHSEPFAPAYKDMSPPGYAVVDAPKRLSRAQETFVRFASPVKVMGSFFVGYRIASPPTSTFAAYNLRRGTTSAGSAWVRGSSGWIKAVQHAGAGFATSLFIDPVIRYAEGDYTEPPAPLPPAGMYIERGSRVLHIVMEKSTANALLTLYDAGGRKLMERKVDGPQATVSLEDRRPGVYIATLRWGTETYSRKLAL
jgi:hypothetical protein